jgi:hypothetical protein
MISKKTMETFYLACGYGPWDAKNRAGCYMNLQEKFNAAREALAEMTEEDEYRIQLSEKEHE